MRGYGRDFKIELVENICMLIELCQYIGRDWWWRDEEIEEVGERRHGWGVKFLIRQEGMEASACKNRLDRTLVPTLSRSAEKMNRFAAGNVREFPCSNFSQWMMGWGVHQLRVKDCGRGKARTKEMDNAGNSELGVGWGGSILTKKEGMFLLRFNVIMNGLLFKTWRMSASSNMTDIFLKVQENKVPCKF